jgi:hypothetical protein
MTILDMTIKLEQDINICQQAVPAHMLVLMAEECQKAGLEFRADLLHKLNMAAAAPLTKLKSWQVSRIAAKIEAVATNLLRDLNPSDPREGLYICAEFCLMLVAEGYWRDQDNMAVLVSLLLIDDIKDDRPDVEGQLSVWREDELKWQNKAKDLILRAQLQGLYHRIGAPALAAVV